MKIRFTTIVTLVLVMFSALSCTHDVENIETSVPEKKQLNIIVLLDLSDRIAKDAEPSHTERDIEIVRSLTDVFRADMRARGTYCSKGKMRVVFSPIPKDPNIAALASKLSTDLSELKLPAQKKVVYDSIENNFTSALNQIYEQSLKQQNWVGCDLWRFFKNDIDLYLDSTCRNIVVVLTDGYLYHENSTIQDGHKYSYITAGMLNGEGLRNELKYAETISKKDIGILCTRKGLDNVEVLVLECDPAVPVDYDVMKILYGKWFSEMGVKLCSVYKTELPVNVRKIIKEFFAE